MIFGERIHSYLKIMPYIRQTWR